MKIDIQNENFFYQDVSFPIADVILKAFKENCKVLFDYHQWNYDHPIDSDDPILNYKLNVIRSDFDTSKKDYDIWGSAGLDESCELSIWITVVIPPRKWQKNIEIDRSELVGTIAHEIHHIAQSMMKENNEKVEDKKFSYFLDPMEVEAFRVGFRAQSVISGIPFDIIATDYLKSAGSEKLSHDDIIHVVNKWKNTDYPIFNSCVID